MHGHYIDGSFKKTHARQCHVPGCYVLHAVVPCIACKHLLLQLHHAWRAGQMPHLCSPSAANRCSPLAGPLLKLHWYVYSMATPVNYKLTLLDNTAPEEPPATANPAAQNTDQQPQQLADRSDSSSTGTDNQPPDVTVADGAAVSFSGSGFVHMEKNWGAAFPEQWVWAQGISGDGKVSCCCCCKSVVRLLLRS
jgi:hypothetical protein